MKCDSSFCFFVLVAGLILAPLGCSKRAAAGSGKESGVPASARVARAVTVATVADQVMERTVAVIGSLAAQPRETDRPGAVDQTGAVRSDCLDLDSRKGKRPGGYQYVRDRRRRPFLASSIPPKLTQQDNHAPRTRRRFARPCGR